MVRELSLLLWLSFWVRIDSICKKICLLIKLKYCENSGTDINYRALLTTKKCCAINGVNGKVNLVKTDLVKALEHRISNKVDLLIFNPPFMISEDRTVSTTFYIVCLLSRYKSRARSTQMKNNNSVI